MVLIIENIYGIIATQEGAYAKKKPIHYKTCERKSMRS